MFTFTDQDASHQQTTPVTFVQIIHVALAVTGAIAVAGCVVLALAG